MIIDDKTGRALVVQGDNLIGIALNRIPTGDGLPPIRTVASKRHRAELAAGVIRFATEADIKVKVTPVQRGDAPRAAPVKVAPFTSAKTGEDAAIAK